MSQQQERAAAVAASPAAPDLDGRPGQRAWPRRGRGAPVTGTGSPQRSGAGSPRRLRGRAWVVEAAVLAGFIAAGVAVTWPRATFLAGSVPEGNDQAQYVWNMWWVAHQLSHLGNPWFTSYLAAPVGVPLGYDTLTPLLGVVMAPVTFLFGPSASYNLLVIVMPGLAAYAMYRLARLWLPTRAGAIAAGVFFGLSGMVTFQDWSKIHTAAGCVFLPLTVEAAVRLRRAASIRRGVILGVVAGAAMLVDQEFAILAVILAALVLVPWLVRQRHIAQWRAAAVSAVTAAVVASPQLIAMAQQAASGGRMLPNPIDYIVYAARLPDLFAPSPRLAGYGMTGLGHIYHTHHGLPGDSLASFGVVLSAMAVLGLAVTWRRRSAWLLALLWLASAALALGPVLTVGGGWHVHRYVPFASEWHGLPVSWLMPDTWLLRVPGMSSFREPDRFAFLGLVAAALLAGAAVEWLRHHAPPLIAGVVIFGMLELGWSGGPMARLTMPTTLPAVDRPIAADHSGSVVVDVPFGIGGIPERIGDYGSPLALVLATADGHPRGDSYTSWVAAKTLNGIGAHAFYAGLMAIQLGQGVSPAQLAAARQDRAALHVGWVLVWLPRWMALARGQPPYHYPLLIRYLRQTGLHLSYQADGVAVYRP